MITFKTINFSNLTGHGWWKKDELEPAPKYENIKKSYDSLVSKLIKQESDIKKYIKYIVTVYGTQTDNTLCDNYELTLNTKGIINITLYNSTIFISYKNTEINVLSDFPVIHDLSELTLKDQMELVNTIESKIKDMTPNKFRYI